MNAPSLVLIVEDNPRNLKLVRDLLDYAGYRTLEATTAEDGIELARSHRPDLVLIDVQQDEIDCARRDAFEGLRP